MREAYWIPRKRDRDQELQRPVLYAPSPYEMPYDSSDHDSDAEADAEESERVVIIEI